jgi:phosphoglycolate phosphatase
VHDLLLFDLDGTLSDPLEGISRSLNHALTSFGYESRAVAEVATFVGPPLDTTFEVLTRSTNRNHIADLVAKYRERYSEVGFSENELYPGIPESLRALSASGIPLAVCTSKRTDFAERILTLFGLRSLFQFVCGGDVGIHKWQQIGALRADGMVSPDTVMIGDRAVDLSAAHRSGLCSAGVLWGFGSRSELEAEAPRYLFSTPSDLVCLASPGPDKESHPRRAVETRGPCLTSG